MRTLIQKLTDAPVDGNSSPYGTALVVGAGQGTDLAQLRRLGAERLILVEADPHQADLLSQRTDPTRGEQAWSLAVTPQEQSSATLRVVNQPQHSSLLAMMGLTDYFRNLAVLREIAVPARSLSSIIASLDLDSTGRHVLVLDAPGQAAALVRGTPAASLQRFQALVVRGNTEPMYEGDQAMDELVESLVELGFDRAMEDVEAIFPHQSVLLIRNDFACGALALRERVRALELAAGEQARRDAEYQAQVQTLTRERDAQAQAAAGLKAQLEAQSAAAAKRDAEHQAQVQTLTRERDAQAQAAAELKAQLEAWFAATAKRDAEHQAQLQKQSEERDALAKLAADRHAQIQKLSQEHAAAAGQLADVQSRFATKQREFDDLSKLAGDRHTLIQKLRNECEEQRKIASAMTGTLDYERKQSAEAVAAAEAKAAAVKTQLEAMTAENSRLKAELTENRNAVALSVRLQTMREADLKDLQVRYQLVHERSEEQHKLLTKLADRLRIASGYFHQMSALQEKDTSRQVLVTSLEDAPTVPSARKSRSAPSSAKSRSKAKAASKRARKSPAAKVPPPRGRGKPESRPVGKARGKD